MGRLHKLLRNARRALLNVDPSFCDMYEDAHARGAAAEYLQHIRHHLRAQFGGRRLSILDAGCQSGRLLIPLAQDGHTVVGIDTSAFALRRARQHARAARLTTRLIRGNIAHLRRWLRPASQEAVICAEVLYLCQNYRTLLQQLAEVTRPAGLLFVSHRPALHYIATALKHGNTAKADWLARHQEGPSTDGAYHNWQTPEQLTALYGALHLQLLACTPIDHGAYQLDLSHVSDTVQRRLAPCQRPDGTFRIPAYLFAVAVNTAPQLP